MGSFRRGFSFHVKYNIEMRLYLLHNASIQPDSKSNKLLWILRLHNRQYLFQVLGVGLGLVVGGPAPADGDELRKRKQIASVVTHCCHSEWDLLTGFAGLSQIFKCSQPSA